MYLFPHADVMGNLPVWSVYIAFLVLSKTRKYTSLCFTPGLRVACSIASSSKTFVDLTHCFVCFVSFGSFIALREVLGYVRGCHVGESDEVSMLHGGK